MKNYTPLIEKVDEIKDTRRARWGRYCEMALELLEVVGYEVLVCKREQRMPNSRMINIPSFTKYFNHERLRYMDINVSKFYVKGKKKQASFVSRTASDADSGCFTSLALFLKEATRTHDWIIQDKTMFHSNRWVFGTGMFWYHLPQENKAEMFSILHNSFSTACPTFAAVPVLQHIVRTGAKLVINDDKIITDTTARPNLMRLAENSKTPEKGSTLASKYGHWIYTGRSKFGPSFMDLIELFNYYHCSIKLYGPDGKLLIDLTDRDTAKCPIHPLTGSFCG